MRVLLTGATGFIGQHVLKALNQQGVDVVVLGRTSPPSGRYVDFIQTDLLGTGDFLPVVKKAKATHLLHLAWYAEHGSYWQSSLNLRWVDTSVRLVEAFCQSGGQGIVLAGTCAEYTWNKGFYSENMETSPSTLYGVSKDATRRLIMTLADKYQIPCNWGRIFTPFGEGEDRRRLIPSLIDALSGKREPFGINTHHYRDFMHVSDVAAGLLVLLNQNSSGIYNISSGVPLQLEYLLKELSVLCNNADIKPFIKQVSERSSEAKMLVGDNQKLINLGWTAKQSLSEGLLMTLKHKGF